MSPLNPIALEDYCDPELTLEQAAEVAADREYWAPLKRELELLRRSRPRDAR